MTNLIYVKRSVKEKLPKQLPNNPEYSIGVYCLTEDLKPVIGYFDLVMGGFIDGHTNNYVSRYKIKYWLEEMSLEEYLKEINYKKESPTT